MADIEIKEMGGKYLVMNNQPVAVWQQETSGELRLYQLVEVKFSELEKLLTDNSKL